MAAAFEEVLEFVRREADAPEASAETTLQRDLGMDGDDLWEFLDAYARRFHVDMSGFLWYFHGGEEGFDLPGALFFKPPNFRVREIPITVAMLAEFAAKGAWGVEYPPHRIPARRVDRIISTVFAILAIVAGAVLGVSRCFR